MIIQKYYFSYIKQQPEIKTDAVYNTICEKCGKPGHFKNECYNTIKQGNFELIPSDNEEKLLKKAKELAEKRIFLK